MSAIHRLVSASSERLPDAPAITTWDNTVSYSDLALATAEAIARLGAHEDGPLLVCTDRAERTAVWLHAGLAHGRGVVLADPGWSDATCEAQAFRTGCKLIVDDRWNRADTSIRDVPRAVVPHAAGSLNARDVVFFTSGTTGAPKAIVHSEAGMVNAQRLLLALNEGRPLPAAQDDLEESVRVLIESYEGQFESGPVLMSCLPPWTHGGYTMMHYALITGSHFVSAFPFDPPKVLEAGNAWCATSIGLAPVMAELLLRERRRTNTMCPNLVVIGLGGGTVPTSLAVKVEREFECYVSIGYGATETGGAVTRTRLEDSEAERTGSVGRPLPGVAVSIRDGSNEECAPGEVGEICVKTPGLMAAIIDEAGVRSEIAGPWYRTGDLGCLRQGLLHVQGRISDLIIRGGTNVDPMKVAEAVRTYQGIEDCAVIGAQSRVPGEEDVVAFVVCEKGTATPDRIELRRHCRGLLTSNELPTRVVTVGSIPRTADGGLKRGELAELLVVSRGGRDVQRREGL